MAPNLSLLVNDLTDDTASPLHVLPQPRVLPDSPSIVHADFKLIVVCTFAKWWPT